MYDHRVAELTGLRELLPSFPRVWRRVTSLWWRGVIVGVGLVGVVATPLFPSHPLYARYGVAEETKG